MGKDISCRSFHLSMLPDVLVGGFAMATGCVQQPNWLKTAFLRRLLPPVPYVIVSVRLACGASSGGALGWTHQFSRKVFYIHVQSSPIFFSRNQFVPEIEDRSEE